MFDPDDESRNKLIDEAMETLTKIEKNMAADDLDLSDVLSILAFTTPPNLLQPQQTQLQIQLQMMENMKKRMKKNKEAL